MIFEQLNPGPCKTYLIGDGREAMIVDPVLERVSDYVDALEHRDLRLRYVVDTHLHADHISGAGALCERTGAAYLMHERSTVPGVTIPLEDGDSLVVGRVVVEVVHVPGHTPDSILLRLADRVLTGDFLFVGGGGRLDLPGGNPAAYWASLAKLRDLPDETLVFPAHDYHGGASSTLGTERQHNPRLRQGRRDEYLAWLAAEKVIHDAPPTATYASALDPRRAWRPLDEPDVPLEARRANVNTIVPRQIGVSDLASLLERGEELTILDVREPPEIGGPFPAIPASLAIPLAEIPHRWEELDDLRKKKIIVVCRSGARAVTAAAILIAAGFDRVYALEGGVLQWSARDRAPGQPAGF